MKSALITGVIFGVGVAVLTVLICYLNGGGGTAIPGAVPILAANAGLVGFIAGAIAGGTSKG